MQEDFVHVKHVGEKDARDRSALRRLWKPGDVKLVPAADARRLTRFAEFALVQAQPQAQELAQAQAAEDAKSKQADKERRELENVHFSIDQMDKAALELYAKRYGVDLDKRRSVAALREEVNGLIELHGVL